MNRKVLAVVAVLLAALITISAALAFSTLSLSKVDFSSNDPSLNKSAWLLTVVEDGNSQYAVGTFDNEQIKSSDGRYAQQDLKIEIETTKNTCEYTFQNSATPIYVVSQYKLEGVLGWYNTLDKCKALYPSTFYESHPAFSGYCFVRSQSGVVAPLSSPVTTVESQLKLTANGSVATGKVGSISQKSAQLADQNGRTRATATWNGNLVSGESCPEPLTVIGVKDSSGFFISTKASYDAYVADVSQDNLKNCLGSIVFSEATLEGHYKACADSYNAKSRSLLTKTGIKPFATATLRTESTGAGKAVVTLPNLIQYPVITMRVDATWLGIFSPVSKPEIVKVETADFTEGSSGNIRATIRNAGSVKGSMSVTLSCTGSIDRTGVLRTISLDPGATGTVDLPISCQADGSAQQGSCTVTAADTNKPDNKDTKSVSALCKPIALCTASEKRCVDNKIQNCNGEGTKWVDQETCLNGCTVTSGVPVCQNAEVCATDSQCDDHDDTTVDQCVGIVTKQCKHVPVPPTEPPGTIPLKLLGFGIALVIFALATYFLASNGMVIPAVVMGILAVASLAGVIIGAFSAFSLLSAWLITIGIIVLLVGIALLEFAPEFSLFAFIIASIFIILGIMLFFTCSNPGVLLKAIGVCS